MNRPGTLRAAPSGWISHEDIDRFLEESGWSEDPARAAAVRSWDAVVERLKATETSGLPGQRLTPEQQATRFLADKPGVTSSLQDQIQRWLEKNKTAVYVSAAVLIGLAVLRRR